MAEELDVEFVIVGAGFAGLAAAWHLAKAGKRVAVLEARDRVGGRVKTIQRQGMWLDLGGTWFGPGQKHSYELAAEMGVALYPTYNSGDFLFVPDNGEPIRSPLQFPWQGIVPAAALLVLLDQFESMARQVPLDGPWTSEHALEWDSQTLGHWIDSETSDSSLEAARTALRTTFIGLFCVDPSEISLLDALHLVHSHGGFQHLMSVQGGDQQDRVVGGAQEIADRVHARLKDAVRLNEPVRKIVDDGNVVTVTSTNLVVRASRAIVTIPLPLVGNIRFEPELPKDRIQLQKAAQFGFVLKVVTTYSRPFWRDEEVGLSAGSFALTDPVGVTFDGGTNTNGPGLLISFMFGPNAVAVRNLSETERRATIRDSLIRRFGPAGGEFYDYHEIEWADEQWTQGGMFAHFSPGALTSFGPFLRQPCGLIHWAGTETSTEFHGSINGAIESGLRAANEVLKSH